MPKNTLWQVLKLLGSAVAGFAALLMVAVLGLLALLAGVKGVTQPTTGYLPVTGTVIDHRARVSTGNPNTSSRNQWNLQISVAYTYTVDGTRHPGLDFLFPATIGSKSKAEQLAADHARRYVKGAPIDLFYNPSNPSESALEHRSWLLGAPALVFGALLLGGALGLGVIGVIELLRRLLEGPQSEPWKAELVLWPWLKKAAIGLTALLFLAGLAAGWSIYPTQVAILVMVSVGFAAILGVGVWRNQTRRSKPKAL
ncbi:DUF3592 domain-containing protein [Thiorhodococcus mannitoliphagus]|uniref:DUF3592 domain-containing protein n=1 Tax=Thiorhodococcus mannitoliphagus TaxID=329406 RepID=A0A6P1E1F7_9GAMM|nr:DUF3592 domain-containing protein [Thiorhodococcus mannitoliphagus]NEX23719.1 DUF3592 domain-containing protein [Thiorhodococcus mannitoliphagus]